MYEGGAIPRWVSAVAATEKPKLVAPLLGGQHLLLLIALYLMIFQPG